MFKETANFVCMWNFGNGWVTRIINYFTELDCKSHSFSDSTLPFTGNTRLEFSTVFFHTLIQMIQRGLNSRPLGGEPSALTMRRP
jgi:hypothetical protein